MMDLSNVVQFPVRHTAHLASTVSTQAESTIRRLTDDMMPRWGHVDDWGRNAGLFDVLTALSEIRWDVSTVGAGNVPARRCALIVINVVYFQQGILGWATEKWPEKFGVTVDDDENASLSIAC